MSLKDLLPTSRWEREKKERKQVAIGATIGLTVGAVAGVLLAPKAGKETREDLAKSIQELPEKAKELSVKTQEILSEAKEKIAEETHKIMSGAKEKVAEIKDELEEDSHFQKPTDITEEQVDAFKTKLKR